jgi:hypothetical protein
MFAAVATAVLLAAVTVQGATSCPTPKAVEARLRPLLPAGSGAASSDVRLEREGLELHVALHAPDGRLTARRTIAGAHSCEALADAAAVIVAAWQGDVGARPLLAAEAPAAAAADLRATAAPTSAGPARSGWGLAAGGGLALAGASPGAAVQVTIVNAPLPDRPWAGRLGLVYQGAHQAQLGGGKLRWQRSVLELGPQVQGGVGGSKRWGWAFHLAGTVGLTHLQGLGLDDARDQQDFGIGAAAGGRLSLGRSGLRPFVELGLRGWPTRLVAYEGAAGRQTTIPRLEGLLTLGGALGR